MNKMGKAFVLCISLVLIAGGVWLAIKDNAATESPAQTPSPSPSSLAEANMTPPPSSGADQNATTTKTATITYADDGFSVSGQVSAGADIKLTNNSQRDLQLASDDHPQHTDNSELNVGMLKQGESRTFKITKTGTWGFHNHLSAVHSGSIVVQ